MGVGKSLDRAKDSRYFTSSSDRRSSSSDQWFKERLRFQQFP